MTVLGVFLKTDGGWGWLRRLAGAAFSWCLVSEIDEMSAEQLADIGMGHVDMRARWVDGTETRLVSERVHRQAPTDRAPG
ncbi:hypothetical protein [Devosia sp.]|uniref:hypothetical protein n=1 Tax=Devosia sp. TaxID=1871048 RepID=UPI001B0D4DF9|nr:hypothetical protein [Devosia sp.]MBO9587176.1 hypothetical protein [Devosia sp.]